MVKDDQKQSVGRGWFNDVTPEDEDSQQDANQTGDATEDERNPEYFSEISNRTGPSQAESVEQEGVTELGGKGAQTQDQRQTEDEDEY